MVAAVQPSPGPELRIVTEVRGAPARLFREQPTGEIIIGGPAGTGKTRAILEWIHWRCARERNLRFLILRKTHESLKTSALVTYTTQVLHEFDGTRSVMDGVVYYGGSKIRPADFTYPTGSKIITAGMDTVSKVLSTEWDGIYVNEITELTLAEYEQLSGRIDRPSIDDKPPSALIGDCNPDTPTHWIKQREQDGKLQLWVSRHEDNPAMWDKVKRAWTEAGLRYIRRLDNLTGVRYQRLRLGKWVAAEGQVYELWDAERHVIPRFDIPWAWPRYWVIDFGYVNPFVWQWWTVSPDGVMIRYREIYMTRRLVEDHARLGMELSANEPPPLLVIADHDAEDRATFELKTGYRTTAANKTVSDGIQAVASRLKIQSNGKPGIQFMADSLVERDEALKEAGRPVCTEEEFLSYVWAKDASGKKAEHPVKENDHGMDTTRYQVASFDLGPRTPVVAPTSIEQSNTWDLGG